LECFESIAQDILEVTSPSSGEKKHKDLNLPDLLLNPHFIFDACLRGAVQKITFLAFFHGRGAKPLKK